jgi:hypothetical protein
MDFQDLFDELESTLTSANYQWNKEVNCLKLQTTNNKNFELIAPIIGENFLAGLERQHADWHCFALKAISTIEPIHLVEPDLPLLRHQSIDLNQFIKTLNRPVRVCATQRDHSEVSFNLLDSDEQFLVAEGNRLIPMQSITQLRMLGTNTWQ